MALNHSKTWPVSTLAVVQLRVAPNGRTYSTQLDPPDQEAIAEDEPGMNDGGDKGEANESAFLTLSQQHVELFTKTHQEHPFKKTVRTDTVSTFLDVFGGDHEEHTGSQLDKGGEAATPGASRAEGFEKFHVLALARIEEGPSDAPGKDCRGRRPSIKVDNWDLIYTEKDLLRTKLCPACTSRCNNDVNSHPSYATRSKNSHELPPDLPLDARKVMTLRRHYYPEGGWGWVIIVCTVLVHVLNVGLQLSCSQLVLPGAEKFKTSPVHIAGTKSDLPHVVNDKDGEKMRKYIKAKRYVECSSRTGVSIRDIFELAVDAFEDNQRKGIKSTCKIF